MDRVGMGDVESKSRDLRRDSGYRAATRRVEPNGRVVIVLTPGGASPAPTSGGRSEGQRE